MTLRKCSMLFSLYGSKLIHNTMSDNELLQLAKSFNLSVTQNKDNYKPVSESNHNQLDLMLDFVATTAPLLSEDVLHETTERFIKLLNPLKNSEDNQFMRNNSLDKIFFAYETVHFPQLAQSHYSLPIMENALKKEKNMISFKTVIMSHCIDFFENPGARSERLRLRQLCQNYCNNLEKKIDHSTENSLAQKKFDIVYQMLNILNNPSIKFNDAQLKIREILSEANKEVLKAKTDLVAAQFVLKIMSNVGRSFDKSAFKSLVSEGKKFLKEFEGNNSINSRNNP